ncbi:MAG: hypothetical protein R2864_05960 [Syntrophotaleaceae bacterium]
MIRPLQNNGVEKSHVAPVGFVVHRPHISLDGDDGNAGLIEDLGRLAGKVLPIISCMALKAIAGGARTYRPESLVQLRIGLRQSIPATNCRHPAGSPSPEARSSVPVLRVSAHIRHFQGVDPDKITIRSDMSRAASAMTEPPME